MKTPKSFTIQLLAGANVATAIMMLAVGYSDRINPVTHPLLANIGLLFPLFIALNILFAIIWLTIRKRMIWLPVAAMIAAYAPVRTYMPFNISREAPEGAIKVLSYNTFYFSTWTDPDTPCEIADYISRHNADIVCLQEANAQGWREAKLDSLLKRDYAHSDTTVISSNSEHIRLLSKMPIVGKEHIYTSDGTCANATAFRVLTAKQDTTIVVVCHFKSTGLTTEERSNFKAMMKGDLDHSKAKHETKKIWRTLGASSALRAPQADAVAKYVNLHKDQSLILTGDFNDSPISYTHHTIASLLTDCYTSTANGPGISYHYNGFYVRIDNIMCSKHWRPYACYVDNNIKASDHYPIICWLERQ